FQHAEAVARAAAEAHPKDYRQQLWLGQVLAAVGKADEAETAFLRAVELASYQPETWVALVQHQAPTDPRKAEATVGQAREKLPAEQAPLALALCYDLLADRPKAEEQYRLALEARPTDPVVLRSVASFYLIAGKPDEAEKLLRKLLDPEVKAP